MILTSMQIGLLPYSDGSGYQFEVNIKTGIVSVIQGGHSVDMKRDEWEVIKKAVDELWASQERVSQ